MLIISGPDDCECCVVEEVTEEEVDDEEVVEITETEEVTSKRADCPCENTECYSGKVVNTMRFL